MCDTAFRRSFNFKQPNNGFLDPNKFVQNQLISTVSLNNKENVNFLLINLASIYLFRLTSLKVPKEVVFKTAILVAEEINDNPDVSIWKDAIKRVKNLMDSISGLDDNSIISTLKLVGFNSYYINEDLTEDSVNPDKETIENVRELVKRIDSFNKNLDSITKEASEIDLSSVKAKYLYIPGVDRHFLSEDTFWYLKVFKPKENLKNVDTLLIFIYYLFGMKAQTSDFKKIKYLGIFDPRSNIAYTMPISSISKKTIEDVEKLVIGF